MFSLEKKLSVIHALSLAPMKIYNHDITLYTHDQHISTRLYSGRALCLTKPGDKIQNSSRIIKQTGMKFWDTTNRSA